ncbi:hypothetical protein BU17DRAFT_52682, partial [Hysterangium stoloniferum]
FFQEDVVRRIKPPHDLGVVLRCWHESEDYPPMSNHVDPLLRPLVPGEIGISFVPHQRREIVSQGEFELLDRTFQPGDVCKRDLQVVESGVVVSSEVEARLEHVITRVALEGWIPASVLEPASDVFVGDYVVLDDWVGQVCFMFDEAIVELTGGGLVRVPQLGGRLQVGDRGPDVLPPEPTTSVISSLIRSQPRPSFNDTVLNVKPTALAVTWLAINQSLDPGIAASRSRPPQFFAGPEMSRLQFIRGRPDSIPHVGEKFTLRDPSIALAHTVTPSVHGREGVDGGVIVVPALTVRETRTRVTILWQDGRKEVCMSKALLPYLNVDEYDCWPGDYVLHKIEELKRVAVVQSVNSKDRTALIRYQDNGSTELVSVLELDPHGTSAMEGMQPNSQLDSFGVRRGDFVFIHREGSTNGAELPRVPTIGELEPWVREMPTVEDRADGTTSISGWRGELHNIGQAIAKARGTPEAFGKELDGRVKPMGKVGGVDWFGEVTDLRTDGNVEVTLGNTDVIIAPLYRLTRLQDTGETGLDVWGDDYSDGYGEEDEDDDADVEIRYESGPQGSGVWQPYVADPASNDEWEDVIEMDDWASVVEDGDGATRMPAPALKRINPMFVLPPLPPSSVALARAQTPTPAGAAALETPPTQLSSGTQSPAPAVIDLAAKKVKELSDEDEDSSPWQRFTILPQAPLDHAFYSSKPAQTTRVFMTRLNKEYRVLKSTLPDSILVRVYEDRADLLRCLIIGPENTPYENAPFVIDWLLDSDFPQTPPQAHFLSWTNGNGRVNPNLYEEGKVCLSILGTWAGDKNESWSAARSSLLQAFVSIQGLVLVKEPWFCEPAFEKLRNTEEGIVNSRLYSEKAYVLSRGFVRRALEIPLGGLESEISWFYYEHGRLQDVISEAKQLIEKSTTPTPDQDENCMSSASSSSAMMPMMDRAVPRLTAGGSLMLSRTLTKLETLLESYRTRTSSNIHVISSGPGKS